MNQEFKRHVSTLERSNDEHKRLVRKREKELDQMKTEFEQNMTSVTGLNHKVCLEEIFSLFLAPLATLSDGFLVYKARRRDQCSASWERVVRWRTETDAWQCQSVSRGTTASEERLRSSIEFHSRRHSWVVVNITSRERSNHDLGVVWCNNLLVPFS